MCIAGRYTEPTFNAFKCYSRESYWKIEDDVMWLYSQSGIKKAGYLLFKCTFIEEPLRNPLAKKYAMSYKFSQVGLRFFYLCIY